MSLFQIPNYTCITQGKYCSQHGGLVIYLHHKYSFFTPKLLFMKTKKKHFLTFLDRMPFSAILCLGTYDWFCAHFIETQIRLAGTKPQGALWSEKNKLFAFSLFHTSTSCYRLLRKLFKLPSVTAFAKNLHPGFHKMVFDGHFQLQQQTCREGGCSIL